VALGVQAEQAEWVWVDMKMYFAFGGSGGHSIESLTQRERVKLLISFYYDKKALAEMKEKDDRES
jgi:hypothetical protein